MIPTTSTGFNNLAGRSDIDDALIEELELAGIGFEKMPESFRSHAGEVKSIIIGTLHGWSFKRAWRYWVCEGPGIPLPAATKLHEEYGRTVRVDGHCGCPSPLEWFNGLGTGHYHVDGLRGLKALADTIKEVVQAGLRTQTATTAGASPAAPATPL